MAENYPLVSILISNYNYARYLSGAIDSAITQTYPYKEIIVVDDGSEDDSRQIINSYREQLIPVYQGNGGQATAINAGFAVSQGEIICLLDADDLWHPEKVAAVVDAFRANPETAVVYHQVQNINEQDQPIGQPWPPYKAILGNVQPVVTLTGGWWPFPPASALSFSRQLCHQIMPIPQAEYFLCADAYLADLAVWFGEVVGVNQVLSQMRIHDSNHWSNQHDQWQRAIEHDRIRVKWSNSTLQQQGKKLTIDLRDRLPYQWLQYKLGRNHNLWHLSRLAWQNPWEHRPLSRAKTVSKLWLESWGIGSSRI